MATRDITEPFAIQALAIPLALEGHDLIGQARTGTGKTLAFGVPLMERVDLPGDGVPQALVVVPTRELCVQVAGDLTMAGSTRNVRVLAIYGGRSYEPQVDALTKGVDVVVGTPGRLLDLARQGHLRLGQVRMLVLDEADEMLDLGFLPDVERITAMVAPTRQTMLFSATMPAPVVALSRRYLRHPTRVRAEAPDETATVPTTQQHVFRAHALDKLEMLARLLQAEGRQLAMIFCRTKRTTQKVADELGERGFAAAAVHGDLGQGAREQALRAFRSGKVDVLVATDVAARGIDVAGVTHVVNYACPEDEKIYLHRIGRTGRAGSSGVAVTFVDWDDMARWAMINKALALPFPEPAETYSSSAHFYEALDIPTSATGTLPKGQRTRAGLDAEAVEDLGETGKARSPRRTGRGAGRGEAASGRGGADAGERPGRERNRSRSRRRTRGGRSSDGAGTSGATAESAPAPAGSGRQLASADGGRAGEGGAPRKRRRRSRGGRGGSGSSAVADTGGQSGAGAETA